MVAGAFDLTPRKKGRRHFANGLLLLSGILGKVRSAVEVDFRNNRERFAGFNSNVKEVARFEIEHSCHNRSRELLARGVVVLDGGIVEAARRCKFVFDQ